MRAVWRIAWREERHGAPSSTEGAWRDSRDEAEALAEMVVRSRRVLGEVLVYEMGESA